MTVNVAQAADLPVAEPVEYVRVCDAFGTGFFYIPGTDTCLKIDGYARYEMHWVDDDDNDDAFNNFTTRARGEVRFDARTMTDLGLLRSYVALRGTIGPTNSGPYSDSFNVDKAWLSLANDFGTLTAGHHGSFFDFFGGSAMNTRIGGDDPTVSTNTLAYTFAVGNGVSASVALEDKWFRRYGSLTANGVSTLTVSEGQEIPDLVANIRIDQGWGAAQIMGAVGKVGDGITGDDVGWAAGAGLNVGVPGTGISLDVQGTWAEGLVAYSTTGNGAPIYDSVVEFGATGVELTRAWAVQAGLSADVSSTVSVALNGSYASVDFRGAADTNPFVPPDFLDYDTWTVAGTVHWKPVPGLTISGEVAYERIDYDTESLPIFAFPAFNDTDVFGAMMRINRVF